VGKISSFLSSSVNISKTVVDTAKVTIDDDDDSRSYSPAFTARNSHERASDTPWQTVQFSDHD